MYLTDIAGRRKTTSSGYVPKSMIRDEGVRLHDYTPVGLQNPAYASSQLSPQVMGRQRRDFMPVGRFRHRRHVRSRPMH